MRTCICLLLGVVAMTAAVAETIDVVTTPEEVPVESERSWVIGPVDTTGRTALLEFTARVDAPSPSGSNYLLRIAVNGTPLTAAKTRRVTRLVNKPLSFSITASSRSCEDADSGGWFTLWISGATRNPVCPAGLYRFVWTSLIYCARMANTITFTNLDNRAWPRAWAQRSSRRGMMRVEVRDGADRSRRPSQ